jgi:plastocyanin
VRRFVIATVAIALTGCGGEGDAPSASGVDAADFRFAPATKRIKAGDAVEWRNTGRTAHTVKGPGFFSRAVDPGGRYSHRFTRPGGYDYVCTLHPGQMRGRVVVGK